MPFYELLFWQLFPPQPPCFLIHPLPPSPPPPRLFSLYTSMMWGMMTSLHLCGHMACVSNDGSLFQRCSDGNTGAGKCTLRGHLTIGRNKSRCIGAGMTSLISTPWRYACVFACSISLVLFFCMLYLARFVFLYVFLYALSRSFCFYEGIFCRSGLQEASHTQCSYVI